MYKNFFKRLIDILGSIVLLLPLFLMFIIVSILIKMEDGGPVFYNADRLGKNGKVFQMYKLRSMKIDAPDIRNKDGSTYNAEDDPRLLKIGKFIRKTSIDELPQILNVLLGQMSFIGPRPDLPEHYNLYTGNESRKLEILPGITGYSQAYFRNSIVWKERIKNDIHYVDNISLFLDIAIIIKTIEILIKPKGIYISR